MSVQPRWPNLLPLHGCGTLPEGAARQRLEELQGDLGGARRRMREVLQDIADKYGIPARDVAYAFDGYADDMLSDLVYGVQRDLEHAAEEADLAS